jgi:lyso-ornithine lipid O-acyltransferase
MCGLAEMTADFQPRDDMRSIVRALAVGSGLMAITVLLLPVQAAALALRLRIARKIPLLYHRAVCATLGVRIRVSGTLKHKGGLLLVTNHVSWLDVSVISAVLPAAFVAKKEVAKWPIVGTLARLQRSIFVNRGQRLGVAAVNKEIADRLIAGDTIVLFAEGTSTAGDEVLPFHSALLGAACEAASRSDPTRPTAVQPMSVAYFGSDRTKVAWPWYEPIGFFRHLCRVLRLREINAALACGETITCNSDTDRKLLARKLEDCVRNLLQQTRNESN